MVILLYSKRRLTYYFERSGCIMTYLSLTSVTVPEVLFPKVLFAFKPEVRSIWYR